MLQEFENKLKNKEDKFTEAETDLQDSLTNPKQTEEFPSPEEEALSHGLHEIPQLLKQHAGLDELPNIKEDISNVIPGAQGPFDSGLGDPYGYDAYTGSLHPPLRNPFVPIHAPVPPYFTAHQMTDYGDATMDEFLEFLELKSDVVFTGFSLMLSYVVQMWHGVCM